MPRWYASADAFRRALEVRLNKVAETELILAHRGGETAGEELLAARSSTQATGRRSI